MSDHLNPIQPLHKSPQRQQFNKENHSLQPKEAQIQISVTVKKKKQVICIESSEEKVDSHQPNSPKQEDNQSSPIEKPTKPKKTTLRCQLCKGTGKKFQMRICNGCKKHCHIQCLDEKQTKKKYVCDKCRLNEMDESKINKKVKKQEQKIQTEKAIQKRLDREKKKDESNKTLQKFKIKYPYYIVEGDRIKFPIEDKLLFIYKNYFELSQNRLVPIGHPLIPSQLLGDFIELENFIVTFGKEFQKDYDHAQHRKNSLYTTMVQITILQNCSGSDKVFQRLLGSIIKIYLKDIFEKNKTENVKILNDNSFFILLGTINESNEMPSDFGAMISCEIIRHLSAVPSMKNAFSNFTFPLKLNMKTKIKCLITLIQGLSQVDSFHDMVGRKSQKIAQLTKDKAEHITKLKKNQAQALSNKQKLKQILIKNEGLEKKQDQVIDQQAEKQLQKNKSKTQKMAKQNQQNDLIIKNSKSNIVKISRMIPFITSEVMFLGKDRNNSLYYFYLREPNWIYVQYKNYFLDPCQHVKIYEGKEKVLELLKSLSTKGIHEKHLTEQVNFLLKQQIFRNLTPQQQSESIKNDAYQHLTDCLMFENEQQFKGKIIEDVMRIEENFSQYLTKKNYQWASQTKREEFRFGFPYIDSVKAMKDAVKVLQESFLFVEVIKERQVKQDDSDSNNDGDEVQIMPEKQLSRRKKPIRIWGINSEKIKKFWLEYLDSCVSYSGIWITAFIFKKYVDRYLEKKMEHIKEQQRKQALEREREERERELQELRQIQKQERNLDRLRSRDKKKIKVKKISNQPIEISNSEGVSTRRRRLRASTTQQKKVSLNLMSESEDDNQDESVSEDECALCGQVGEMICCDSCPKVFHIECVKIKQIPEGDWNCFECLHKMANERQTRSRLKKLNK